MLKNTNIQSTKRSIFLRTEKRNYLQIKIDEINKRYRRRKSHYITRTDISMRTLLDTARTKITWVSILALQSGFLLFANLLLMQ